MLKLEGTDVDLAGILSLKIDNRPAAIFNFGPVWWPEAGDDCTLLAYGGLMHMIESLEQRPTFDVTSGRS